MPRSPEIRVQTSALLGLALMLMLVELRWVGAFLLSAAIHELCHILALLMLGCPIQEISVGLTGAKLHIGTLSRKQALVTSLSGPVGGLLLTMTGKWFPRLAVCAFFHSVINLIPLYPLDGGRALRSLLPEKIHRWTETVIAAVLLGMAGRVFGIIGVFFGLVIIGRPVLEKFLAKNSRSGYNRPTIKKEVRL